MGNGLTESGPALLNILFLQSCRTWGGGEVWLAQIVGALRDRGHKITVACNPGSAVHLRMGSLGSDLVPVRLAGDFDPLTISRLRGLITSRHINVICVHSEKELRLGGMASMLTGVPVVVSREVDFPIHNTFMNRLFYRDVAAVIIANSFATKNTLLISAPWLDPARVHVVWKGIDAGQYKRRVPAGLRDEFHIAESDIVAGFVGRLDEQKGVSTLLEAMSILSERTNNVKLVFAGEGNMLSTIEAFRRDRNLEDRIYVAGFRKDIPEFLSAIDFLVMPSNWEGFGYAAVEAMASGKAVIASHVSSLPEIVVDQHTGLLIPPRSPERLAGAMLTLSQNPLLRNRMGKAGARRVRTVFSFPAMVQKMEALFLRAASHGPLII